MQASARREHHLAIVDSTTRDQTLCPHPSNYFVEFPKPFKNVFGVELVDAYLPRSMYTVDEFNNEIVFGIYVDNVLVKSKFTFVPQNYNISTLIEALSSSVGVTTGDGEVVNLTVSAHSADDPTRTSRLQIVSDYRFVIWSSQSSANEVIGFGEARADANGMPYLGDDYAAYLSTADQEYDQGAVDLAGGAAAAADALIARGASRTVLLRQDDLGVTATVGLSAEATHVTFWARDPLVRTDISCAVACVQDAAWTVLSSETLPASAVSVVLDDSSGLWAITADLGAAVIAQIPSSASTKLLGLVLTVPEDSPLEQLRIAAEDTSTGALDGADYSAATPACTVTSALRRHGIVSPGRVNLIGSDRYIVLRCPEIESALYGARSFALNTPGIAIFKMGVLGYSEARFDFNSLSFLPFHPIGKLTRLTFRFETRDGSLYNFRGLNHHLLLAIKYYTPDRLTTPFGGSTLAPDYDPTVAAGTPGMGAVGPAPDSGAPQPGTRSADEAPERRLKVLHETVPLGFPVDRVAPAASARARAVGASPREPGGPGDPPGPPRGTPGTHDEETRRILEYIVEEHMRAT